MTEHHAENLQEFIRIVEFMKFEHSNDKMGGDIVYRGIGDRQYKLLPCIYREETNADNGITNPSYYCSENEILHHFRSEASSISQTLNNDNIIKWMEYGQHFGVPTRLLDFTTNPMVALFFCCINNTEDDGVVWAIHQSKYMSAMIRKSLLFDERKRIPQAEIFDGIKRNVRDPKQPCIEFPMLYAPIYVDQRMTAQQSRYMIWGSDKRSLEDIVVDENYIVLRQDHSRVDLANDPECLLKIIVPGHSKRKIRKQLSICGINEKTIFPGMDGIGRYIRSYYEMDYYDYVELF